METDPQGVGEAAVIRRMRIASAALMAAACIAFGAMIADWKERPAAGTAHSRAWSGISWPTFGAMLTIVSLGLLGSASARTRRLTEYRALMAAVQSAIAQGAARAAEQRRIEIRTHNALESMRGDFDRQMKTLRSELLPPAANVLDLDTLRALKSIEDRLLHR